MTLEVHELAALIPPMTEEEYVKLRDDIRENGLIDPITLYEGRILDGRHRYRACQELSISPATKEYTGDDPVRFVVSLNVHRRHLSPSQLAAVAVAVLPYYRERAKERQQEHAATAPGSPANTSGKSTRSDETHPKAVEEAAADVGASGSSIFRASVVQRESPELFEQIQTGKKTVNAAYEQVRTGVEKSKSRRRDITQPFEVNSEYARTIAEAARQKLIKLTATLNGYVKVFEDFDTLRAVAGAKDGETNEWIRSLDEAIKALRQLRNSIKEGA